MKWVDCLLGQWEFLKGLHRLGTHSYSVHLKAYCGKCLQKQLFKGGASLSYDTPAVPAVW